MSPKVTVNVIVPPPQPPTTVAIHLTLTVPQAEALFDLTGKIGGPPNATLREVTTELREALDAQGIHSPIAAYCQGNLHAL